MSLHYRPKDTRKPRKKKKFRLSDINVATVGLVDTPAVEGSRFLIAKRADEVDDELSALLFGSGDEQIAPVLLTTQEIAYYRYREKAEAAHEATLDWLAGLSEGQFLQELGKYDEAVQRYWIDEIVAHLEAEQG